MKEIKFRRYSFDSREMVYSESSSLAEYFDENSGGRFSDDMQYTGVKDKNNIESAAGDIIKYAVDSTGKFRTSIIEKKGGAFCYKHLGGFNLLGLGFDFAGWLNSNEAAPFEVVGNIYENAELREVVTGEREGFESLYEYQEEAVNAVRDKIFRIFGGDK